MNNINPAPGYVYGKRIVKDTGVVTGSDMADTSQRYEILAIGDNVLADQRLMEKLGFTKSDQEKHRYKVGDHVLIQKHAAEGDTPSDMYSAGFALFLANRIMACVS